MRHKTPGHRTLGGGHGDGATGPQGPPGEDGLPGATGPTGADGTNGINGINGINGVNGVDGINGSTGPTGPKGATGAQGIPGAQGIQGIQGNTGAEGSDGSSFTYRGTWNIGTHYVENDVVAHEGSSFILLVPSDTGTEPDVALHTPWDVIVIAGPQGVPGIQGAPGIQGPVGPTGPAGADGTDGINGTIGPTGHDGTNGTNGIDGAVGPTGPTGPTGAAAFKALARDPGLLIFGAITRDANGAATGPDTVKWPDGDTGLYTALVIDAVNPDAVNSYKITKDPGGGGTVHTYTQPTMTRDGDAETTVVPEIVVTP